MIFFLIFLMIVNESQRNDVSFFVFKKSSYLYVLKQIYTIGTNQDKTSFGKSRNKLHDAINSIKSNLQVTVVICVGARGVRNARNWEKWSDSAAAWESVAGSAAVWRTDNMAPVTSRAEPPTTPTLLL